MLNATFSRGFFKCQPPSTVKLQRFLYKNIKQYGLMLRYYSTPTVQTVQSIPVTIGFQRNITLSPKTSKFTSQACFLHSSRLVLNELESNVDSQFAIKDAPGSGIVVRNINLPGYQSTLTEEQFLAPFAQIDEVVAFSLDTISKGFGFIYFKNPESADRAIDTLNGSVVGSRPCNLRLAFREKGYDQSFEAETIYVKGIKPEYLNDTKELGRIFGTYGNVKSIFTPNSLSGGPNINRTCFVKYDTKEEASVALKALDNHIFDRRVLTVRYSFVDVSSSLRPDVSTPSLWIGNLNFNTSSEEVASYLEQFGTIKDISIPSNVDGSIRGYCFVTYGSVEEAKKASVELSGNLFEGRPLTVRSHAEHSTRRSPNDPSGVKELNTRIPKIYVGNFSYHMPQGELLEFFKQFGTVVSINTPIDNATGLLRGFSFVEYETIEQALEAVKRIDNVYYKARVWRARFLR